MLAENATPQPSPASSELVYELNQVVQRVSRELALFYEKALSAKRPYSWWEELVAPYLKPEDKKKRSLTELDTQSLIDILRSANYYFSISVLEDTYKYNWIKEGVKSLRQLRNFIAHRPIASKLSNEELVGIIAHLRGINNFKHVFTISDQANDLIDKVIRKVIGLMKFSPSLLETLALIKRRIEEHPEVYKSSEIAVARQLLEPVLRALGWNIEDPKQVIMEPDQYLLIKDGEKVMIIKVTKLGELCPHEFLHLLDAEYFNRLLPVSRVPLLCLLTDGKMWLLYYNENKYLFCFWDGNIEENDLKIVSEILDRISVSNIDGTLTKWKVLVNALEYLGENIQEEFFIILRKKVEEINSNVKIKDYEIEGFIKEFFEGKLYRPEDPSPPPPPQPQPTNCITIDEKQISIKHAYEILTQTAEWLVREGRLRRDLCPIGSGYSRYIVHYEPIHPSGKEFFQPKILSNGLWVETNIGRDTAERNARVLLTSCGLNANILKVHYR